MSHTFKTITGTDCTFMHEVTSMMNLRSPCTALLLPDQSRYTLNRWPGDVYAMTLLTGHFVLKWLHNYGKAFSILNVRNHYECASPRRLLYKNHSLAPLYICIAPKPWKLTVFCPIKMHWSLQGYNWFNLFFVCTLGGYCPRVGCYITTNIGLSLRNIIQQHFSTDFPGFKAR